MGYDSRLVFARVTASLQAAPRIRLSELARQLKIERHTIERAVLRESGRRFRELQGEVTCSTALELLAADFPRSVKEISFALGYASPAAMSRFVKRACGKSPTELRFCLCRANDRLPRPGALPPPRADRQSRETETAWRGPVGKTATNVKECSILALSIRLRPSLDLLKSWS